MEAVNISNSFWWKGTDTGIPIFPYSKQNDVRGEQSQRAHVQRDGLGQDTSRANKQCLICVEKSVTQIKEPSSTSEKRLIRKIPGFGKSRTY